MSYSFSTFYDLFWFRVKYILMMRVNFLSIVKNATSSHSIMLSELACSFSQPSSFVFVLSNVYPNDAF